MPLYEYQCQSCGSQTEVLQRFSDPPKTDCEECGGELKKLISAPAFQFKGDGWYVTDYARKDAKGGAKDTGAKKDSDDSPSGDKKEASGKTGGSDGGSKEGGSKDGGSKESGGAKDGGSKSSSSKAAA